MSKPSKHKNGKVPKITEEEYAAYLSVLKSSPPTPAAEAPNATAEAHLSLQKDMKKP